MGTIFEDAAGDASCEMDCVYSECWLFIPFTAAAGDVNGRPSPDPDRAQLPIRGYFIDGYARARSAEARKQGVKPERPGHASSRPQIDLDIRQLPYRIRQGDRLQRISTGAFYHVAEGKFPTSGTRWQLDLNEI